MGILNILTFNLDALLIILIALALNLSNVWGYYKCSRDAQKQVSGMAAKGFMAALRFRK